MGDVPVVAAGMRPLMLERALAIAVVAVLVTPLGASALYRDTGFDPNDVTTPNDLRATTRSVVATERRHMLRIVLLGYQAWPHYPDYFQALVRLDARGGPRSDVTLKFFSGQDVGCLLDHDQVAIHASRHGARFVCRVPMSMMHANKRIRWRVITTYHHGSHPDVAPNDRGWYV
jgi:hypothetical protein